jgi:hypothetical protein
LAKLIYLASPYTDPDPEVMEKRFNMIAGFAAWWMLRGYMVISPIIHNHPLKGLPPGFDFWHDYNRELLSRCDELWICKFPGWDFSAGITGETEIALELGKPIRYMEAS